MCFLDPAYLALLAGDLQRRQASNVFDMGGLLNGLSDIGRSTNSTIILVHHTIKRPQKPHEAPQLHDLAFAGVSEWARQWLLLGRRQLYAPGSGEHKLWMNVGGSAGHSGTWAVDVDEGIPDEKFAGRYWSVGVREASEAADDGKRFRQSAASMVQQTKILRVLKDHPRGETARAIREQAGLNLTALKRQLAKLQKKGLVERCNITKHSHTYEAFRLRKRVKVRRKGTTGTMER